MADAEPQPPGVAEGLFLLHDPAWRSKVFTGGLLLLVPFFGWFTILGYRKALIGTLFRGDDTPLPLWRGQIVTHTWEGLKAAAVIFTQYTPFYAALLILLHTRGATAGPFTFAAMAFFTVFTIFTPLAFPLTIVLATWPGGPEYLTIPEAIALLTGYTAVTFIIPAGFLQVSLTGHYTAALRYDRSLPFLARNFTPYCLAWYRSLVMSVFAHAAVPFSPWGVVWCYLGIIYSFNRVLADELARRGQLAPTSWFVRLRGFDAIATTPLTRWTVAVVQPVAKDGPTVALRVGPAYVPLPRMMETFVAPRR